MLVLHNTGNVLILLAAMLSVWEVLLVFISAQWRSPAGKAAFLTDIALCVFLTLSATHETISGVTLHHLPLPVALWYEVLRIAVLLAVFTVLGIRVTLAIRHAWKPLTWADHDASD